MNAAMKTITNIGISLLLKISTFEDKSKKDAAKIIGKAIELYIENTPETNGYLNP